MQEPINLIQEAKSIDAHLRSNRKKLLILIGILILVNTVLFTIFIPDEDYSTKFISAANANLLASILSVLF